MGRRFRLMSIPGTGQCTALVNQVTGAAWVEKPFPLFLIAGGLTANLEVTPSPDGLRLTLRIRNDSKIEIETAPVFPNLEFRGRDAADHRALRYCFPARAARIGNENISDRGFYSGIAPLQFLAADHPRRGSLHVVIEDTSNSRKLFGLDKDDTVLRLFAEHEMRRLAPGEEWILPPVLLGAGDGTWHSGLAAYRAWLAKWYKPDAPRSRDFRSVFNFRVFYPHHAPPMGSDVFNPVEKRWSLPAAVERDAKLFGGVDFVHLYGWAATPEHGRVGDYRPWDHIGGLEGFRDQLTALHRSGIPTGLYIEGYLASPESKVAQESGAAWGMRDAEGKGIDTWGGGYSTMCAHHPGWQDYLAETCGRLTRETGARGFTWTSSVSSPNTAAPIRTTDPTIRRAPTCWPGRKQILRKVREAVGDHSVVYTEEIPTDVMTRHIDGAYTAAVTMSLARGIACPIHLTRFALPDFKTIELISEHGIGDNLPAVRATFFNGEAIYLSGDASLFSPACLALIRKTHGILREHADAFTSMEPMPLVPTLSDGSTRIASRRRANACGP
jgi:hypothetical protein